MRLPRDKWDALCTALGYKPEDVQRIEMYSDGAVEIRTWDDFHSLDTYR